MSTDKDNTLSKEFSKLAKHFLPSDLLIQGIETLGEMKKNVILLDNALQELSLSSDLTASQLKNVTEEAFRLGDATGKSGTEILSYINSAKKAGYDIEQSMTLTQEALKLSNISPGIDNMDSAIEYMKNMMQNFGKDTDFTPAINDALVGVSRSGTVDFDTLAQGASKLAKSAGEAGLSFEEMLGLLTGAYDVLKDMDQVTSGEAAMFSSLKEAYGDTKNIYELLEHLSTIWDTLDESSKKSFAASSAGEGQQQLFTVLMENWQGVEQAVQSASYSFGAADEANAQYVDSIAGKTAQLQNQIQQLSASVIDSDLIKFFLDLGIVGTKSADNIVNKFGSLTVLGTLMGGYLSAKNLGRANTDSCPSFNMPSLSCFSWIQGFYGRSCAIHG